jgi:hypothetical protein
MVASFNRAQYADNYARVVEFAQKKTGYPGDCKPHQPKTLVPGLHFPGPLWATPKSKRTQSLPGGIEGKTQSDPTRRHVRNCDAFAQARRDEAKHAAVKIEFEFEYATQSLGLAKPVALAREGIIGDG